MEHIEGVLGPRVIEFVEQHVTSLLAWDVIVFFHRHPDDVFDLEALALRLGRDITELASEVEALASDGILQVAGGLIRYRPASEHAELVDGFVDACRNRNHRLALIARVLRTISPHLQD